MPKSLDDIIESIIDLRSNELASLRLHLLSLHGNPALQGQVAAMIIAREYAFLESGLKEIINAYIESYGVKVSNVRDLKDCYVLWRFKQKIRSLICNAESIKLLNLDSHIEQYLYKIKEVSLINIKDEYRTMNYEAIIEIVNGCGLATEFIDRNSSAIGLLCIRRHTTAHGRFFSPAMTKNLISDVDVYKRLVVNILYDIGIQCIESRNANQLLR